MSFSTYYASMTSSRLAVLVDPGCQPPGLTMVVWDWRTGRVLLEQRDRIYKSLVFTNEHSFAVLSVDLQGRKDPRLHIFDTGRGTTPEPVQTSFLPPIDCKERIGVSFRHVFSEPCGHAPLPDELLLEPFYQDPSQRILAIDDGRCSFDVINVELLLELARKREGQNIGWAEWGPNTTRIQVRDRDQRVWVSGCRLFCVVPEGRRVSYLQIYDLSRRGRSKHVHAMDISSAVGGSGRTLPSVDGCELPWVLNEIDGGTRTIGNDGIALCVDELYSTNPKTLYVCSS